MWCLMGACECVVGPPKQRRAPPGEVNGDRFVLAVKPTTYTLSSNIIIWKYQSQHVVLLS